MTSPPTPTPTPTPTATSRRARWQVVLGGGVMAAALGAYEVGPASVTPLIRETFGVGPAAAGLLVSVMFGTAVVASIPLGAALDRTDSRRATAVAVVVALVAGVAGWQAARYGAFRLVLLSRVFGGLAYTVVWNAGIDIVGRSFEGSRQATAVGVFTAFGPVGFALGQAASPLVAGRFGWSAILVGFPLLAACGLALFWPPSRGRGTVERRDPPTPAEFRAALTNRSVWLVGTLGFLGYAVYLFVNSWGPSYLTARLGYSLALSGLLVALFPAVGVLARTSSGALSNRVFGGRRRPVVLLSFLVTTPIVAGFTALRSVAVVVAALLVAGFAVQLSLGLSFGYVRELVDPTVAATAVAFLTSVSLAGAFVAPVAAGALIDASGYPAAFAAAGGLAGVGALVAWRAPDSAA
ncbi:MAG: nitrate/nitrite transporter [Haloplanus sp.]